MNRLIIAPVGFQAAAVLAPLCSKPLRPSDGDHVLLVVSEKTKDVGARIKEKLAEKTKINNDNIEVLQLEEVFPKLENREKETDVWFLVNGGPGEWILKMMLMLDEKKKYWIVNSRDDKGIKMDKTGKVTEKFIVADVSDSHTPDDLLKFLNLEYCSETKTLKRHDSSDTLEGIEFVQEKSGFLFVAINASEWDLATYRKEILSRKALLVPFNLDKRRVFLKVWESQHKSDTLNQLIDRAKKDGVLFENRSLKFDAWCKKIESGEAFTLSEQMLNKKIDSEIQIPSVCKNNPDRAWVGRPLIVVMGPEPSTTLTAIWTHKPAALVLLYDKNHPLSCQNTARIIDDKRLYCKSIDCLEIPAREVDSITMNALLVKWNDAEVDVNLRPGDKYSETLLRAWVLQNTKTRKGWYLFADKSVNSCISTENVQNTTIASVPLQTSLTLFASQKPAFPGPMFDKAKGPSKDLEQISKLFVYWMRHNNNVAGLHQLWNKQDPPQVIINKELDSELVLEGENSKCVFKLNKLAINDKYKGLTASFIYDNNPNEYKGQWFEWVIAAALFLCGVENVQVGVEFDPYIIKNGDKRFKDEIDIVTRHKSKFASWSIKLGTKKIVSDFEEARSQADRLIGRNSMTVLVVPWLKDELVLPSGMKMIDEGHYRDDLFGDIIDVRVLMDSNGEFNKTKVQEIAGYQLDII
jgi:hypothetical protein